MKYWKSPAQKRCSTMHDGQVQVDVSKFKNLGLVSTLLSMCKLGYVGHSKRATIVIFIVNYLLLRGEEGQRVDEED